VGDEDEEYASSKDLCTMMKEMTELLAQNQQSTDMTLEQVDHSIASVIDQVDALETRLPPTDQDKLLDETRGDDYEEEEDKPFNPPRPPPQRQYHDD
jgi:hypothetical protein